MGWCKTNVEPMIIGEGLLQLEEIALQEIVEDYVVEKRKGLSPNTLPYLLQVCSYSSVNKPVS